LALDRFQAMTFDSPFKRPAAPTSTKAEPAEMHPEEDAPAPTLADRLRGIGDPDPGAPVLRKGSKGAAVTKWQKVLQGLNPSALPRYGADGDFGNETVDATKAMQVSANALYLRAGLSAITVDGVVGPQTRTAASRLLEINGGTA
jgi:peptidoglycan hydrolase-like protein with peptidoglycan-binding domain